MTSSEPNWLSLELILAAHSKQIEEFGGTYGLRDQDLLESAIARPQQQWSFSDPAPDACSLAASYAFGLVKNHAFLDGNKRIAHVAYRLFLAKNGLLMTATREEKYSKMIALASSETSEEDFAEWLRSVTEKA